jgi:hypothetical protein
MAVKKPTTTEELTASAVDPAPTRTDLVEGIVENTDPEMVAKVDAPKTYKVKSPAGDTVEVPESILDALLDSGYSKTK